MDGPPPYRFPGMDPWLEWPGIWTQVHKGLIVALAWDLSAQLRPRYIALSEERVVVEEPPRSVYPDVAVFEHPRERRPAAAAVAVEEPVVVHLESEPARQWYIEIVDPHHGRKVVTVIEVLSPSNKERGQDARDKYVAKQEQVLAGDVNLVEIDLLRGGLPTVAVPPGYVPPSDYRVVLRRAGQRSRAEVYPVRLQDRLPRIRIPLKPEEPDAGADLQKLLERVHQEGCLGDLIDYSRPLDPPLEPDQAKWAAERLAASPPR